MKGLRRMVVWATLLVLVALPAGAADKPLRGIALVIGQGRAAMQKAFDYYGEQNGAAEYYGEKLAKITEMQKGI